MEKGCDIWEVSKTIALTTYNCNRTEKIVIKWCDQVRHLKTTVNFVTFLLWSLNKSL